MNGQADKQAPLEDIMVAMDVVDTLRHQRGIAEREMDGQGRQERLLERLKKMYTAQGIDVPDHVLQEGIDALEQERFQYQPVTRGWRTKISSMWVSRRRWGKPVGVLVVLASLFTGIYIVTDVLPERALRSELPKSIRMTMESIEKIANDNVVVEQAKFQAQNAATALSDDDLDRAQKIEQSLKKIDRGLKTVYSVRVISRQGEDSGVWRIPDVNDASRNYYLIVEAVDHNNNVKQLEILNEETNKRSLARTWGIRVSEETFFKIAADKKDDGIIQGNKVGEKRLGDLAPTFSIPTTGGTITDWARGRGQG
ncbi:MAG: hypothetical protein ACI9LY_004171 [Arenicella sp.]|jgi:hypothetical protein